jgi:hypothetical protein
MAGLKVGKGLRPSGILRGICWYLISDVSGTPIGTVFKHPFKKRPTGWPEKSVTCYQAMPRNIREARRSQLHRDENLKSHEWIQLWFIPSTRLHEVAFQDTQTKRLYLASLCVMTNVNTWQNSTSHEPDARIINSTYISGPRLVRHRVTWRSTCVHNCVLPPTHNLSPKYCISFCASP